jgi:hypothetical protein
MKIIKNKKKYTDVWYEIIECDKCHSKLLISPSDIQYHKHEFCGNCSWRYIECPVCKKYWILPENMEYDLLHFAHDNNISINDFKNYN